MCTYVKAIQASRLTLIRSTLTSWKAWCSWNNGNVTDMGVFLRKDWKTNFLTSVNPVLVPLSIIYCPSLANLEAYNNHLVTDQFFINKSLYVGKSILFLGLIGLVNGKRLILALKVVTLLNILACLHFALSVWKDLFSEQSSIFDYWNGAPLKE